MGSGQKCVIVLGDALTPSGEMTDTLRLRLEKTLELCAEGMPGKIIVTGGKTVDGIPYSEAYKMAEYLKDHGIKESVIVREEEALNTIENAYFSRKIVGDAGTDIVVVTSDTHASRAYTIFRKIFGNGCNIVMETSPTPPNRLLRILEHERISLRETEAFGTFRGDNVDAQIKALINSMRKKAGRAQIAT